MAVRTDITVDWTLSPRIVEIASPSTELTIQDLHDTLRDFEDFLANGMQYNKLVDSFGKQDLGGGSFVGITMVLQNTLIAFEARPGPTEVLCTITGGNLVAVDSGGSTVNPISPTAFTQVVIQQSTSPSIITPPEDLNLLYLVESLRGTSKAIGNIFYWDPTSGVDTNDGLQPSTAKLTFASAQALATAGAGDVIFAVSSNSSGVTTTTEKLTITTAGLKIRGSGYAFQLTPSTSGADTVTISADGVEFEGFYIDTAGGGTDNGITITTGSDKVLIKDCWIKDVTGNGIDIAGTARVKVDTCAIEDSTGNGINIGDSTILSTISKCIISGNADGIDLSGSSASDNIFENNLIYNNSGWGVDIGTGVTRTGIRLNHTFSGNTSGETNDNGTSTFIETIAGGASASSIADAVWDEVISGHITTGTTGKTLKDAKTRATLASLK